jgi:hypothetical protein
MLTSICSFSSQHQQLLKEANSRGVLVGIDYHKRFDPTYLGESSWCVVFSTFFGRCSQQDSRIRRLWIFLRVHDAAKVSACDLQGEADFLQSFAHISSTCFRAGLALAATLATT